MMTRDLALPAYTSLSGEFLIYVMFPLLVISVAGAATAVLHVSKRLTILEQGLAILVSQVSPPGSPALRDLVQNQAVEVATLRGLVAASIAPEVIAHIERTAPK